MKKYFITSDTHVPFHDKELYKKYLQCLKDSKPNGFVIVGDWMDMYSLSHFNENSLKNLGDISLDYEYSEGNKLLDQIDTALPKDCSKMYLYGNHEARFNSFMEKGDNSKLGLSLLSPTEGLKLRERGYQVKENWKDDYFLLGKHLEVIHGIYHGKYACQQHLMALDSSVIFGHSHKVAQFISGKRAAYNIGHMVDGNSQKGFGYMPRVQRQAWCQGFGIVNIDDHGDYYAQVIQVHKGRFIVDGKLY